jgi:hypothetical protein
MTFEQMERAMEFMLEQQARSLEHQAQTDARFKETGEILNRVGLQLDILAADAVAFDARMDKLHDEIAAVRDVAISHNQAIHQLFRLHEQTQQKFEWVHEQRKDEFELNQQNFEILNEQREREMEDTRKKFELANEQRQADVQTLKESSAEAFDLIKQLTRKIDSLADALTKPGQNGRQ